MLKKIGHILTEYKILRGMLSYAVLWPTGSLIEQTLMEKRNWRTYDWNKCLRCVFTFNISYSFISNSNYYQKYEICMNTTVWVREQKIGLESVLCLFEDAPELITEINILMIILHIPYSLISTKEKRKTKKKEKINNFKRPLNRFSVYGGVIMGPTMYVWIRIATAIWPRSDFRSSVSKAITEQFTYDPASICTFLFVMSLLESGTVAEAKDEVRHPDHKNHKSISCHSI